MQDLDFQGAMDGYLEKIRECAAERGDTIVMDETYYGQHILGIQTKDGHPLSFSINYTP
jgi:hypothetical protein